MWERISDASHKIWHQVCSCAEVSNLTYQIPWGFMSIKAFVKQTHLPKRDRWWLTSVKGSQWPWLDATGVTSDWAFWLTSNTSCSPELVPKPVLTASSLMACSWHTPVSSAPMCMGFVNRNFLHMRGAHLVERLSCRKCTYITSKRRTPFSKSEQLKYEGIFVISLNEFHCHLSVLLSTRSQRSSATRNTALRLMGREMVWTWPSSTSTTSSWFLSK